MGASFSAPVQTGPGAHPASCTMGTGSFLGAKRPGRCVNHPPPSMGRGHERVELYLYSPSGGSWPIIGRTLPYPLHIRTLSSHLRLDLPSGFFPQVFLLLFPSLPLTPLHHLLLHLITLTIFGRDKSLSLTVTFIPLRPKYLPQPPDPEHHHLMLFP